MKDQSAVTDSRPRRTVKFQVQSGNTLPGLGPDFSFSVAAAAVRNSLTSKKNNDLSPEARNFGLGLRRGSRTIELPFWRRHN